VWQHLAVRYEPRDSGIRGGRAWSIDRWVRWQQRTLRELLFADAPKAG
jgi:hypothetical protein